MSVFCFNAFGEHGSQPNESALKRGPHALLMFHSPAFLVLPGHPLRAKSFFMLTLGAQRGLVPATVVPGP